MARCTSCGSRIGSRPETECEHADLVSAHLTPIQASPAKVVAVALAGGLFFAAFTWLVRSAELDSREIAIRLGTGALFAIVLSASFARKDRRNGRPPFSIGALAELETTLSGDELRSRTREAVERTARLQEQSRPSDDPNVLIFQSGGAAFGRRTTVKLPDTGEGNRPVVIRDLPRSPLVISAYEPADERVEDLAEVFGRYLV